MPETATFTPVDDRTFFQKALGRKGSDGAALTADQRIDSYWWWAIFSLVAILLLPIAAVVGGILVLVLLRKLVKVGGTTDAGARRAKQAKVMAIIAIALAVISMATTNAVSPVADDQTCLGQPGDDGIMCFPNEVDLPAPPKAEVAARSAAAPH